MAKAGSKGGGHGGGATVVKFGEEERDLKETPLKFGEKDPALAGASRKTVEDWENKRYKNKIEFSQFSMDDGSVYEENKGARNHVGATPGARRTADVLTHNHPRYGYGEEGYLSGTFSNGDGDLDNFCRFNQRTYRATGKEGTYSISKGKNFDSKLAGEYGKAMRSHEAEYDATMSNLRKQLKSNQITYTEQSAMAKKAFNKWMVQNHNWLLANQKTYGYNYTLERRG